MKKRDPVAEYCHEWVRWCQTRGMYMKKAGGSLLGRMQASKTGTEPNARNHPDMTYFNMAVHALADMPKWTVKARAFMAYYVGDGEVVKRTADQLGIGRRTYYDHVKSFADQAHRLAASIKKSHETAFAPPPTPPTTQPRPVHPGR
jgi:hypothetical protein